MIGRSAGRGFEAAQGRATPIVVWDPVVRIFHWGVVIGCMVNLFVLTDGGRVHRAIGYGIAALLAVRLVWGFAGTRYARFRDFVPTPSTVSTYLGELARGQEKRHVGHNPAGAVMMLLLLALLGGVSVSGWMLGLDRFWGVGWVLSLHEFLADAILVLALVHAAAALFESWRHRENLVWSMITGRKRP